MKKVDLDKLHNVALGKANGRGCGKTTLFCMEMIGLSQLESFENRIIAIYVSKLQEMRHLLLTLIDCCCSEDIEYKSFNEGGNIIIKINKTEFRLLNKNPNGFDCIYYDKPNKKTEV